MSKNGLRQNNQGTIQIIQIHMGCMYILTFQIEFLTSLFKHIFSSDPHGLHAWGRQRREDPGGAACLRHLRQLLRPQTQVKSQHVATSGF